MNKKTPKQTHRSVLQALRKVARQDKAEFLPKFFGAVPGGYGEGDRFLGVVVPDQRKISHQFRDLTKPEIANLLGSCWHECRLTGVFILVSQFEASCKLKTERKRKQTEWVRFYLNHLAGVNNWDLVDGSAPKILGPWLLEYPTERKILRKLAKSKVLWEQRISVLGTMPLIKSGEFDEFLQLAEGFLDHPHDLMHKAVGWMLREMGKQDVQVLRAFLDNHVSVMPRTMLRYAIEKMSKTERRRWLER